MNNLQYIIRNNTRAAMHMAVELCEQGDFDDVYDAVKWLMKERDDAVCKVIASFTEGLMTPEPQKWFMLSCGHSFKLNGLDAPVSCPVCGKKVNNG